MKSELFIICMENSLWAQYIIEFFKFVGFSIIKQIEGDVADRSDSEDIIQKGINRKLDCNRINIVINEHRKSDQKRVVKLKQDSLITINASNDDFNKAGRKKTMRLLLDYVIKGETSGEYESLTKLYNLYEENNLFFTLYNVGLIKYSHEYQVRADKENDLLKRIKVACKDSKKTFIKTLNELFEISKSEEENFKDKDKYIRYAILLLMYKLNELKMVLDKSYIFSSEDILSAIDELTDVAPNFMRPYYLAACVCRTDSRFNWYFLPYIYSAIEASKNQDTNDIEPDIESFLKYQIAKYYEEYNYRVDIIKDEYYAAASADEKSCMAKYKHAKYLYVSGDTDREVRANKDKAENLLREMEKSIVNGFDRIKLMPKRKIHGYLCCEFLGNISLNEKEDVKSALGYYLTALRLSVEDCQYFDIDNSNYWKEIFFLCMPLRPITESIAKIYAISNEELEANELRKCLRSYSEQELRNYWKEKLT